MPTNNKTLTEFLQNHKLSNFISTSTITNWQKKFTTPEQLSILARLIIGLANKQLNEKKIQETGDEFINLITNKKDHKSFNPKFKNKWTNHFNQAPVFLQSGKPIQALEQVNQGFIEINKEQTTYPEVFRFFSNKAIAHFYLGAPELGKKFLEIAIKLNPNYDFAIDKLKEYKDGTLNNIIEAGKKNYKNPTLTNKTIESQLEDDPAYQYYEFLKQFKINFKTKTLTQTKKVFTNPDGSIQKPNRNESCPCGSGKKYKKCCI